MTRLNRRLSLESLECRKLLAADVGISLLSTSLGPQQALQMPVQVTQSTSGNRGTDVFFSELGTDSADSTAAVPFHRVINNTIYGSRTP